MTVLAVLGVGVFAVSRALSGPTGADTPEEAAAQLFVALDNEDPLGVAEIALPGERESILEPGTDLIIELARLDFLDESAVEDDEVQNITGLEIDVPAEGEPGALTFEVVEQPGSEGRLHWVTVTDGVITTTFDPTIFQDALGEQASLYADPDPGGIETETIDLGEEYEFGTPLEFAVVEQDGSYYVSFWYTVAGFANGFEPPILSQALQPVGAESAEQAAVQLLENVIGLDAAGTLSMMDPVEFGAAYDYWASYGPDLSRSWDDSRLTAAAEGVTWEVVSAEASSSSRNGRQVATFDQVVLRIVGTEAPNDFDVTIDLSGDGISIDGTIQGEPLSIIVNSTRAAGSGVLDGEAFEFEFDFDTLEGSGFIGQDRLSSRREGDCVIVESSESIDTLCEEDLGIGTAEALDLPGDYLDLYADVVAPGLTVVERDGRWYVSGMPTILYAYVDFLKAVDEEELQQFLERYEEVLDAELGEFEF